MARGKAHSEETRAAVMAALLTGQSVNAVARQYRLSRATVIAWRDLAGVGSTPVEHEKLALIGDKLVDYLDEVLTTLRVQAVAFRDVAWLKAQPADQAAILHGVLTDKAVRLLEALDNAAERTEESQASVP